MNKDAIVAIQFCHPFSQNNPKSMAMAIVHYIKSVQIENEEYFDTNWIWKSIK